jgi:cysteinyl-tRNA synthetase
MPLKLYNTKTRRIDEFQPIEPGKVSLYVCGPTVYNYAHIGNLRTYVFEDVLVRALRADGYNVRHVMNVTDVGHLTSDADEGEDKMALGARREGKTVWEIAQFYWDAFKHDIARLNILPPDVWCRATEHIDQQKAQVEALAEGGYTYVIDDGVYFDTSRFDRYGEFARLDIDGLRAGHRVEMAEGKRNLTDFALWKFSPKDRQRLMEWDNPLGIEGKGFPGWHIECSTMAIEYLGERLDIHCGGVDHINVHHTNEIAQAECAMGHEWCNWWMHGEFLTMPKTDDGPDERMSKSSGEFLTLDRLAEKGYDPPAYRYFLLGAHYRQQLAFSYEGLSAAVSAMKNLKRTVLDLRESYTAGQKPVESLITPFREAVCDDLNMPRALAAMWNAIRQADSAPAGEIYATLLEMDGILGLGIAEMQAEALDIDEGEIDALLAERTAAKADKNFARADEIRSQLIAKGIEIMDGPEGTTWRKAH